MAWDAVLLPHAALLRVPAHGAGTQRGRQVHQRGHVGGRLVRHEGEGRVVHGLAVGALQVAPEHLGGGGRKREAWRRAGRLQGKGQRVLCFVGWPGTATHQGVVLAQAACWMATEREARKGRMAPCMSSEEFNAEQGQVALGPPPAPACMESGAASHRLGPVGGQ